MSNRVYDPSSWSDGFAEINLAIAEFPSDALSVKRFRKIFPEHFDHPDTIADGYSNNLFFFRSDHRQDNDLGRGGHMVRLSEVLADERTIASGAFFRTYKEPGSDMLNADDEEVIGWCKERLEENYQYFKLADSPETARMLVRQCELEGENQARQLKQGGRRGR